MLQLVAVLVFLSLAHSGAQTKTSATASALTMSKASDANSSLSSRQQGCACIRYSCGCCGQLSEPVTGTPLNMCVKLTVVRPPDSILKVTIDLNRHSYYEKDLPLDKPPPACFAYGEHARVCVRFHDMIIDDLRTHICYTAEVYLDEVRVAVQEIGCSGRALNSRGQQTTSAAEIIDNTKRLLITTTH